jgi:hypothetical protein
MFEILLSDKSVCDHNFTIESFAVSLNYLRKSKLSLHEFVSHKEYYWVQSWKSSTLGLRAQRLPNGFKRYDSALVGGVKICSNHSLNVIAVESKQFITFETDKNKWKSPQLLKDDKLLIQIISDIKMDEMTDWTQNTIIIFENNSYITAEWTSICDAMNGESIKKHPSVDVNKWFGNEWTDGSVLFTSKADQNSAHVLYIFSDRHIHTMTVKAINTSNGHIIGDFKPLQDLDSRFLCSQTMSKTIEMTTKDKDRAQKLTIDSNSGDKWGKTSEKFLQPDCGGFDGVFIFVLIFTALLILVLSF